MCNEIFTLYREYSFQAWSISLKRWSVSGTHLRCCINHCCHNINDVYQLLYPQIWFVTYIRRYHRAIFSNIYRGSTHRLPGKWSPVLGLRFHNNRKWKIVRRFYYTLWIFIYLISDIKSLFPRFRRLFIFFFLSFFAFLQYLSYGLFKKSIPWLFVCVVVFLNLS